jgi:hypothetical protein
MAVFSGRQAQLRSACGARVVVSVLDDESVAVAESGVVVALASPGIALVDALVVSVVAADAGSAGGVAVSCGAGVIGSVADCDWVCWAVELVSLVVWSLLCA